MKNIDKMHQLFGIDEEHQCKECCNFTERFHSARKCFKCMCYGETCSEATDWRKGNVACGLFNTHNNVRNAKDYPITEVDNITEGQIAINEINS